MTSIPTVKAALVAALMDALPDVTVIYGPRSAVTLTEDKALTVEGALGRRDIADLAGDSGTEEYDLRLAAAVGLAGPDSMQMAEEQALDIYATAVSTIAALHVDDTSIEVTGEFELTETVTEAARIAVVQFTAHIFAANV